ncbi:hypothetical protein GGF38_005075, partial [Coemansia sp. RSA 25]
EKNIYSGEALERLSQTPYDGRAFPRVRTLKFIIYPGGISDMSEDMEIDALVAEANIRAFVRRIREIAPALNEIHVGLENSADVPEFPSQYFGGLAPQLFGLANRIGYSDAAITPVLVPLQLNSICHLSSIKSDVEITSSQFIRLARQNAQTLQSLVLATDHGASISSLVQNDDGSYVTYPQLVALKLSWCQSRDGQQRPAFGSGVVPFPSLQRVELPSYYPFGDNTLFRGNATTLERLAMKLEAPTVAMLRRYNVFTPTSHPNLWYVRISYYDRLVPGAFATIDESVSFSLGIGPAASVRELSGAANIDKPATTLTQLSNHANIQILSLVRIQLDLWDVIALIKSLPLLTDLHSSHPHVGAIPAGITHDELPAYLHSNYSPVGERFRCWHFYNQMINYYAEIS